MRERPVWPRRFPFVAFGLILALAAGIGPAAASADWVVLAEGNSAAPGWHAVRFVADGDVRAKALISNFTEIGANMIAIYRADGERIASGRAIGLDGTVGVEAQLRASNGDVTLDYVENPAAPPDGGELVLTLGEARGEFVAFVMGAGDIDEWAFVFEGDNAQLLSQTSGSGAFALTSSDFISPIAVEAHASVAGAGLMSDGTWTIDPAATLVAEYSFPRHPLDPGVAAPRLALDAPFGTLACPCAIDGFAPGAPNDPGDYVFRLDGATGGHFAQREPIVVGMDAWFPP